MTICVVAPLLLAAFKFAASTVVVPPIMTFAVLEKITFDAVNTITLVVLPDNAVFIIKNALTLICWELNQTTFVLLIAVLIVEQKLSPLKKMLTILLL